MNLELRLLTIASRLIYFTSRIHTCYTTRSITRSSTILNTRSGHITTRSTALSNTTRSGRAGLTIAMTTICHGARHYFRRSRSDPLRATFLELFPGPARASVRGVRVRGRPRYQSCAHDVTTRLVDDDRR